MFLDNALDVLLKQAESRQQTQPAGSGPSTAQGGAAGPSPIQNEFMLLEEQWQQQQQQQQQLAVWGQPRGCASSSTSGVDLGEMLRAVAKQPSLSPPSLGPAARLSIEADGVASLGPAAGLSIEDDGATSRGQPRGCASGKIQKVRVQGVPAVLGN